MTQQCKLSWETQEKLIEKIKRNIKNSSYFRLVDSAQIETHFWVALYSTKSCSTKVRLYILSQGVNGLWSYKISPEPFHLDSCPKHILNLKENQ